MIERVIVLSGIRYAQGNRDEANLLLETEFHNLNTESIVEFRNAEKEIRFKQLMEDYIQLDYKKSEEAMRHDDEFNTAILLAMVYKK